MSSQDKLSSCKEVNLDNIDFIARDVYIYRWREGQMIGFKGDVCRWARKARCFEGSLTDRTHIGRVGLNCSPRPGEVYDYTIWFYDDNPNLALGFFMNYEEDMIAKHKEQVKVHERRLWQMRLESVDRSKE